MEDKDNYLKLCNELCQACPQKDFSPEQSAAQKEGWLKKTLAPWSSKIEKIRTSPKRFAYRNKVCLRAQFEEGWKIGMTQQDEILEIPTCPIHTEEVNEFVRVLKPLLPSYQEFPLAYLYIAQKQITFILKDRKKPELSFLSPIFPLMEKLGFEGLWLHLNPVCGMNVFMGKSWELVWGKARSKDQSGLLYGPASFSQLIPELHQKSLDTTFRFFALNEKDKIIDLYSGNGSSLKRWNEAHVEILGIEIVGEAIECAKLNVPEASVLRGLAKDRLPQMEQFIEGQNFSLYANPPRTGLEPEVVEWLRNHPPQKMAYLSCSAGTLARDLEKLSSVLEVESITPYDFFFFFCHVETLVLLKGKTMSQKTCPKCGKKFECTHDANCWCMTLVITPQNLKRLKAEYSDCLCEECLKEYSEKKD